MNAASADDARTAASVSLAWLIVFNKPFYPLYVWWLAGADAAWASAPTMIGGVLYLAIPFVAKRAPFAARAMLPLVGLADTLFATKLFGAAAGTELFLFDCALLGIVVFETREYLASRGVTAAIFLASVAMHGHYGAALSGWAPAEAARLFELNAYSAASLTAFIAWRFSRAGSPKAAPAR
jgi:hypothetical protein